MSITIKRPIHLRFGRGKRKVLNLGRAPDAQNIPVGSVPRISKLMALAIRFENLIRTAQIGDQADVARLGRVSRPRVTQIMNLLHLAPDIQEAILHLPRTTRGRDPIQERHVRPLCASLDWRKQRRMWVCIRSGIEDPSC